ncbi:glycoside hydrolase family 32 protein [Megamonas funiformis]|uniref:glycoside hydrolase family 32 protein n=1 Tax=Megamonas funiformis TaxID=437897 RepID=UPI00241D53D9|nr:GH32 C-terminal domain-containing protein [Megamonas funiformis]
MFAGKNNDFFLVIGAQTKQTKLGAIALYHSLDGENWQYMGSLATSNTYQMIECPDMFRMGDKYILFYCPQYRDNEKDIPLKSFSVYKVIDLDETTGEIDDKNLDENYFMMDYGFDFYAPQTFEDDKKRRILWAWMSRMNDEEEKAFAKLQDSIHCLTMPREILLEKNRLYQRPVKELYNLLGQDIIIKECDDDQFNILNDKHTVYLKLENIKEDKNIDWIIEDEFKINYNFEKMEFSIYRLNWLTNNWDKKSCKLEKIIDMELWIDNSSIEIFINEGEKVFSSRIYRKHEKISISGNLCGELIAKNIDR